VPVEVEGGSCAGAIAPESNPPELWVVAGAETGVEGLACDEAFPRSTSIAPKKAIKADTRSAAFALSARARAAAMREFLRRSGGGKETVMPTWNRRRLKAA
jgi:hypothetical protein